MTAKKILYQIHLWLGLLSGLLVFVIAITGCIYAFQEEIQDLTQPYRFVEPQAREVLPPSQLRSIADAQLPGRELHGILYGTPERAANAIYWSYEDHYYDFVYLNPYTGEVLQVVDVYSTFFRWVLDGHFYLWMPEEIGQPVVASATLVFVVLLLSGLYLWWPRKKKGVKKSFSIKWDARWRRKNYDLHQVLGFYASALALVLAVTGLCWGFEWFKEGVYASVGGEKSLVYEEPLSDTTQHAIAQHPVDVLWEKIRRENPGAESIEMHFPASAQAPIHVAVNPDAATYWQIDYLYFDQYSLEELPVQHIWNRFEQASTADKLMRLNYDIHVGAIGGLAGKFLAFCISLMVASLPITGFLMWLGRRKKEKKHLKNLPNPKKEKLIQTRARAAASSSAIKA